MSATGPTSESEDGKNDGDLESTRLHSPDRELKSVAEHERLPHRSFLPPKRKTGEDDSSQDFKRPDESVQSRATKKPPLPPPVSKSVPIVEEAHSPSTSKPVRPIRDASNLRDIGGVRSSGALPHFDRPPPLSNFLDTSAADDAEAEIADKSTLILTGTILVAVILSALVFGAAIMNRSPDDAEIGTDAPPIGETGNEVTPET